MGFRLSPVLIREARFDHPRPAFGDEQARRTADHANASARGLGRLQQRRDRGGQLEPVVLETRMARTIASAPCDTSLRSADS